MPPTHLWNWKVPGIVVNPPSTRKEISEYPAAWDELTFDPLGAYDLRRHLGAETDEQGRFMTSRRRFQASEVAFLAAGASEDGQHSVPANSFFPEFKRLRDVLSEGPSGRSERQKWSELVQKTVFDLVTKWDRCIGSTTIVLHVEGTTIPEAPLIPEFLKAHVCIPPSFVNENPGSHVAIANIVQLFIENVGIPTAAAWTRRGNSCGWPLSQSRVMAPPPTDHLPLVPPPAPHSSYYLFRGRSTGTVLTSAAIPPPPSPPAAVPEPPLPIYDIDCLELEAALERNEQLESDIQVLTATVAHYEDQQLLYESIADGYKAREHSYQQRIQELEAEVAHLQSELREAHFPASASRQSSPTKPRSILGRPPPYASTASSPSPAGSSRRAADRMPAANGQLGPLTQQFLERENLRVHSDALRLICSVFSPVKWAIEIEKLSEFPPEFRHGLLEALEQDTT